MTDREQWRAMLKAQRQQLDALEAAMEHLADKVERLEGEAALARQTAAPRERDYALQMAQGAQAVLEEARARVAARTQALRARLAHPITRAHAPFAARLYALEQALQERFEKESALIEEVTGEFLAGSAPTPLPQLSDKMLERVLRAFDGLSLEMDAIEADFETPAPEPDVPAPAPVSPPAPPAPRPLAEIRIGQRVVGIAGICMVLLGVLFGLQYTYTHLLHSDVLKLCLAYALGLAFTGAGAFFSRRRKNPFALGLAAGGVAILYVTTAMGFFAMEALSQPVALALCVASTVLAFWLSTRRASLLIALFALIGGHLPMAAVAGGNALYAALAYFLLLNLLALAVAWRYRWPAVQFVSFGLFAIAMLALLGQDGLPDVARLLYLYITFFLYLGAALLRSLRTQEAVPISGLVLLALNATFHCTYLFFLLGDIAPGARGLLSLTYCAIFFAAARLLRRALPKDQRVRVLFYTASFTFLALFAPMQLDRMWFSLAWVIQGTALAVYGALTGKAWYRRCGLVIYALCAASFMAFDLLPALGGFARPYYIGRFGAVIAGLAAITLAYLRPLGYRLEKGQGHQSARWLYNALLPCLWLYLAYALTRVPMLTGAAWWVAQSLLAMGLCVGIARLQGRLRTGFAWVFACVMLGVGGLLALAAGAIRGQPWLIAAFNLLFLLALADILRGRLRNGSLTLQAALITLTLSAVALGSQMMLTQAQVPVTGMALSFAYMACGAGWVALGFARRFTAMRRMGLGFALASTAKFFVIDLFYLESWQRILCYFVLGGALLGISFVYSYFEKRVLGSGE